MWKHKTLVLLVLPEPFSVEKNIFETTSGLNTSVKYNILLSFKILYHYNAMTSLSSTALFHHIFFWPKLSLKTFALTYNDNLFSYFATFEL